MNMIKWNDNWKYWEDGDSFALIWNISENAEDVTLPHDAMISNKAYAESPNGGSTGFRDGANYVYVKNLELQEKDRDLMWSLKFEGVYMNTYVYVNGQLAGKNFNGYTGFYVALDDFLKFDGHDEIRVQVRNKGMTNSRWYAGGGIYRDVYLISHGASFIEPESTWVKTNYVEADYADLEIKTSLSNKTNHPYTGTMTAKVKNIQGMILTQRSKVIGLRSGVTSDVTMNIMVEEPKLWSDESPKLYLLELILEDEDGTTDLITETFGIRTMRLDSRMGLRVNGKQVNLRGACIHDDSGVLGVATYEDYKYRQIKKLKEAGFNAIRMAHHPASKALLRACDRLGVYVMDETFDMWTRMKSDLDYGMVFDEAWEQDVRSMVKKNYNHPSVILYSLGNEIPEVGTIAGMDIGSRMNKVIKELDDSRYTLTSINGVFASGDAIGQIVGDVLKDLDNEGIPAGNVNNFLTLMDAHLDRIVVHPEISKRLDRARSVTDITGYNYMTARYALEHDRDPYQVIVGSETYPPQIAENWQHVTQMPHVIGDFTWTGWDYIGEAGVGIPAYNFGEGGFGAQFPCQLAYSGDIDLIGVRRPASYYREIVFGLTDEPYIAVQRPEHYGKNLIKTPWVISDTVPSWSYPGYEGKPVIVEVYGSGDEVELYLNDQLVERKVYGQPLGCMAHFHLQYQQGLLKAVNLKDGQVIGERILMTVNDERHLKVSIEEGDSKALAFAEISLLDGDNHLVSNEDCLIHVEVEGGELLGIGTGNPKPIHGYKGAETMLFGGSAMAVIKVLAGSSLNVKVCRD